MFQRDGLIDLDCFRMLHRVSHWYQCLMRGFRLKLTRAARKLLELVLTSLRVYGVGS